MIPPPSTSIHSIFPLKSQNLAQTWPEIKTTYETNHKWLIFKCVPLLTIFGENLARNLAGNLM